MAGNNPVALAVVHSFGSYNKGQLITDAQTIRSILDGGMGNFVVPTIIPQAPKTVIAVD